jgi:hypothetical protein
MKEPSFILIFSTELHPAVDGYILYPTVYKINMNDGSFIRYFLYKNIW